VDGLPTDGLPTLVVTYQLQVERRTGKVRQSETDVLPLCYASKVFQQNDQTQPTPANKRNMENQI